MKNGKTKATRDSDLSKELGLNRNGATGAYMRPYFNKPLCRRRISRDLAN